VTWRDALTNCDAIRFTTRRPVGEDGTFPSITPHDLRHTAASLAISAGAKVKAVQRMLGHAKASKTLDVYADLFDDDLDVVADRLNAAIQSAAYCLRTGGESVAHAEP
jgi:integrase